MVSVILFLIFLLTNATAHLSMCLLIIFRSSLREMPTQILGLFLDCFFILEYGVALFW